MNRRVLQILFVIFLTLTVGYSIYIELATRTNMVVNTNVEAVVDTKTIIENQQGDHIKDGLSLELDKTKIVSFELLNRDLPVRWQSKKIRFKYTYIGEYSEDILKKLNSLVKGEYKWQNQLDENGDILLGAPILERDGVYQLHPHNSLYLTTKYYLFGDLLHWLRNTNKLEGTEMKLGNVVLKCIWIKDMEVEKDSSTLPADLIISTCLERNGDRRLVSGWEVVVKD